MLRRVAAAHRSVARSPPYPVCRLLLCAVHTAPVDVRQCGACHLVLPPEMPPDAAAAHVETCAARRRKHVSAATGTAPTAAPAVAVTAPEPASPPDPAHPQYAPAASTARRNGHDGGAGVVTTPFPGLAFRSVRSRGRTVHDTLLAYLFTLPWARESPVAAATSLWNPLRGLLWAQAQSVDMPWTTSGFGMADLSGAGFVNLEALRRSRNLGELVTTLDGDNRGLLARAVGAWCAAAVHAVSGRCAAPRAWYSLVLTPAVCARVAVVCAYARPTCERGLPTTRTAESPRAASLTLMSMDALPVA